MAMTLTELAAAAMVAGLRYRFDESRQIIIVGFDQTAYRDPNTGMEEIVLLMTLSEDGRTLQVFAPACYDLSETSHREAVFSCLLQICYRTSLLQYEFDPDVGFVHYVCELPVEDGKYTAQQIGTVVRQMAYALEHYDPIVRRAMATGEVDFGDEYGDPGLRHGAPLELADLVRAAGGVEGLRRLLRDAGQV